MPVSHNFISELLYVEGSIVTILFPRLEVVLFNFLQGHNKIYPTNTNNTFCCGFSTVTWTNQGIKLKDLMSQTGNKLHC